MTEHFEQSEWIRFVREGAAAAETTTQAMRAHLAQGCPLCHQDRGFVTALAATLRADRNALPPRLRQRALSVPSLWPRTRRTELSATLRLAFDSLTAPRPAAVRGSDWSRRHCVYELGSAGSLEVMVEPAGSTLSWSVLGQVLRPDGTGWAECALRLADAAAGPTREAAPALAHTTTNYLGEFNFIRGDAGPWRLDVTAGGREWRIDPVLLP